MKPNIFISEDQMLKANPKYQKLLIFVSQLADESVYERYENLNEMNWSAHELLKEIDEI